MALDIFQNGECMKLVNIRIRYGCQVMTYDCEGLDPVLGDWVVVKNEDLTYLGQVVTAPVIYYPPTEDNSAEFIELPDVPDLSVECSFANYQVDETSPSEAETGLRLCPHRRLLRLATEADLAKQAEQELREKEAFEYCLSRIIVQGLEMKLVAVEILFDGSKTIFYYTADERVDFRMLVKELVSRFRTRIEMRQIGVRHEARMVGGLGQCGRCFCCSGFLSNFAPVSVKMAKEQNISLSPSKISGVCGRLMCCLAFEHTGPPPKAVSKNRREIDN